MDDSGDYSFGAAFFVVNLAFCVKYASKHLRRNVRGGTGASIDGSGGEWDWTGDVGD